MIVEPGTRNIYIVGKRGTQPSQETTPGGASDDHWAERAFVLKIDPLGNVLWNRELNKDGMKDDPTPSTGPQTWRRYSEFAGVCLNPLTGDVYCVGETNAHYGDGYNWSSLADDCLVAKYDSSGTLQYQKFYGRNLTEWGQGVTIYPTNEDYVACEALSDGRFVAAGNTTNSGTSNNNFLLTAWNANGTVSWSKWISINGTQNNTTSTVSSCGGGLLGVDSSDNVYVIVNGGSASTSHVMKFNSSGTVQWQKNISRNIINLSLIHI